MKRKPVTKQPKRNRPQQTFTLLPDVLQKLEVLTAHEMRPSRSNMVEALVQREFLRVKGGQ